MPQICLLAQAREVGLLKWEGAGGGGGGGTDALTKSLRSKYCATTRTSYLVLDKEVEHVIGQLPVQRVLDGQVDGLCFDFGFLSLWRLVGFLLLLALLRCSLEFKMDASSIPHEGYMSECQSLPLNTSP